MEQEAEELLLSLLVNDQMWGSVVQEEGNIIPVCFGSAIFISNELTREVLEGKHPFLFLELCENQRLRENHILRFEEVEKSSSARTLNFYGVLFSFAKCSPHLFPYAMRKLQEGLMMQISGFGLCNYIKQTYESHLFARKAKNWAMRTQFGAKLATEYRHLTNERIRKHHPCLFHADIPWAESRFSLPIGELMSFKPISVGFSFAARMVLRSEIENLPSSLIAETLFKQESSLKNNWDTIRKQAMGSESVSSHLSFNDGDRQIRDRIRKYISENPQELGVLPPLTPGEKAGWERYLSLSDQAKSSINCQMSGDQA